ncbi:DUF1489 family protein [Alterisphingorhabdus coralli]|uniref:DUF1489 domain-containing protein n=1 Tax=Alterisphingorhabdus coralli TaxID=3071408 RepID=A0AA97F9J4_9SPHN|nr:DUF1489 domain-containing protein [Parasphingorhabdus sp. SCSIO 66989]WOE74980.1 DUF1489 domain-containing protein [Parasphingorhabdus sp. SCSIO 66989]
MPLHLTKIAFRSESPATLRRWLESHGRDGGGFGEARLTTRYKPKRKAEIVGGSLYWIHSRNIVGRSPIIGFQDNGQGKYWIRLEPRLIAVEPTPRRAHQGWRYLEDSDAPKDIAGGNDMLDAMPAEMLSELSRLALL